MKFFNRVHVVTTTTGTGSLLLGAAAADNVLTLAQAGAANNDETTFVIEQGADFEISKGIVGSSGLTLTRATVLISKIGSTVGTTKLTLTGAATVKFFPSAESVTEVVGRTALQVIYDNVASGLTATNVKAAIDEIAAALNGLAAVAETGAYADLTGKPTLGTAAALNSGTASGNVPVLDGSGLLPVALLPAIAITDVYEVGSQAAMLALTAQKGDVAIRTDLGRTFALGTNSPTTLADWKELKTPTDVVLAVAGLTGTITASDLRAALNLVIGTDVLAYDAGIAAVKGKQSIWVPAGAMTPNTTNGPASGKVEATTNKEMLGTLDFDASTIESAQFTLAMPKQWNEGTVTFKAFWKHAATTTNFKVAFDLAGYAASDDDAADAAFGTVQQVDDTGGTTNDIYVSPESSAITIAGTPAAEDLVFFRIRRKADDGTNDTMAIDAGLLGIMLYITTDAGNDA